MNIHKIFMGNGLLLITKTLLPIIIVPIFLKTWGSESYTEWLLILSYVAFLGLFDLGLSNYSITHVHLTKSKGRHFTKILNLLTSIYISLTLAILVSFTISIFLINQIGVKFSIPVAILLGVVTILSGLNGYINSISRIYNNQHHVVYRSLLYNGVNYVGLYFLLQLQVGQVWVACWMLFCVTCSILLTYRLVADKYSLSFKYSYSARIYRAYLNKSVFYLLYKLTAILKVHLPIIIISFVNPLNTIIFTLHRTIVNMQNQIVNVVNNSMLQDLTRNSKEVSNLLCIHFLVFGTLAISISFVIHLLYRYIFEIWIGEGYETYINIELMLPFLCYALAHILWSSTTIFLISKNDHVSLSKKTLIHTVLSNLLSIPGYYVYGLQGYMWSMVCLEVILGQFWLLRFILAKLNVSITVLLKAYSGLAAYLGLLFTIHSFDFSVLYEFLAILCLCLVCLFSILISYKVELQGVFKNE